MDKSVVLSKKIKLKHRPVTNKLLKQVAEGEIQSIISKQKADIVYSVCREKLLALLQIEIDRFKNEGKFDREKLLNLKAISEVLK